MWGEIETHPLWLAHPGVLTPCRRGFSSAYTDAKDTSRPRGSVTRLQTLANGLCKIRFAL